MIEHTPKTGSNIFIVEISALRALYMAYNETMISNPELRSCPLCTITFLKIQSIEFKINFKKSDTEILSLYPV